MFTLFITFFCQKFWRHFILREVLNSTDWIWSYYTVEDDLDQPVLLPPRAWITGVLHDAQFIQCWVSNPEHLAASYLSYLQSSGESVSTVLAYSKSSGIRGSVGWKDSSVVSRACCSCRELEFSLQQMHGGSQSGPSVQEIWPLLSSTSIDTTCTWFMYTHAGKTHIHLKIFFLKNEEKCGRVVGFREAMS